MSKRTPELFLFDVVIAILKIKEISKNFKSGEELKSDFVHWDAVIREFEIIGEATNKLIKAGIFSDEKRAVVDFRNMVIHEYFGIDEDIVWNIIQEHLDKFLSEVLEQILKIEKPKFNELKNSIREENKHIKFILDFLDSLT